MAEQRRTFEYESTVSMPSPTTHQYCSRAHIEARATLGTKKIIAPLDGPNVRRGSGTEILPNPSYLSRTSSGPADPVRANRPDI
jgi:hypothetical protein